MLRALSIVPLAAALALPGLADGKSLRSRKADDRQLSIVGSASGAIESARLAVRHVLGRAHLVLRSQPEVGRVVEIVGAVESFASLAMPGFRLPIDVHDLPVLIARPARGDLSSPFGYRRDPIRKRRHRFHRGIDFHGKRGHPVYSAGPGVVTKARRKGGYGRVVYIDHGLGLETRYAHLHRIHVEEGDFVPAGTLVGRIGSTGRSTGPHLHFEVRRNGRAINPDLAMDVRLFDGSGLASVLATVLNPRDWSEPPRKKRKRRRRARKRKRVPRSKRIKDLW